MTAMSLDTIPTEVTERILRCFAPRLRQWGAYDLAVPDQILQTECLCRVNLAQVSRTCRRLHTIALPILYHTIPAASPKLLSILAHNEYVASLVKSIDLYPTGMASSDLDESLEAANLPPAVKTRLSQIVDVGERETAIHLLLLPNIEEVANVSHYVMRNDVVSDLFRQSGIFSDSPRRHHSNGTTVASLKKPPQLRALRLQHFDTQNTAQITWMQDLLQPTVQSLRGIALAWLIPPDPVEPLLGPEITFLPDQLALRTVEILQADVDAAGVEDILRRCPDLRSLHLEWGTSMRGTSRLDFSAMGNALRKYASRPGSRLENLVLDVEQSFAYAVEESDCMDGRLGSLRALGQLKSLSVQQDILCEDQGDASGDDDGDTIDSEESDLTIDQCLPDSLERICLLARWPFEEEELDRQLCELVQADGRRNTLRCVEMPRKMDKFTGDAKALGFRMSHKGGKTRMERIA